MVQPDLGVVLDVPGHVGAKLEAEGGGGVKPLLDGASANGGDGEPDVAVAAEGGDGRAT